MHPHREAIFFFLLPFLQSNEAPSCVRLLARRSGACPGVGFRADLSKQGGFYGPAYNGHRSGFGSVFGAEKAQATGEHNKGYRF